MEFLPLPLSGAVLVKPEAKEDERGSFSRVFCRDEFAAHGLNTEFVQCSVSVNKVKGTLRGMHYQRKPNEEIKLVRCTRGLIYDVIVDLRPESSTYKRWVGIELSADNHCAVYIPKGVAHGFITLVDEAEVFYQMSEMFHSESAAGVRWNDPTFAMNWPVAARVISERDRTYSDFKP